MKSLLLLYCLTAFLPLHAQSRWTDFSVSRTEFTDTIPMEFRNNVPTVSLTINGRERRFLLDTGATLGCLFASTGIMPQDTIGVERVDDVNRQTDSLYTVTLPPFRLGSLTVTDYPVTLLPKPAMSFVCDGIDGIIGFNLFEAGLSAKIDGMNHRLILTDRPSHFRHEQGYGVKYKLQRGTPYIWIRSVYDIWEEVLMDTGSNALYMLGGEHFARFSEKKKRNGLEEVGHADGNIFTGLFGNGEKRRIRLLQIDRLQWDDFTFREVRTITHPQGVSRIGAGILNHGSLVIDPDKRRFVFQPYQSTSECQATERKFHIDRLGFDVTASSVLVSLLWEEGEPYRLGIRRGDTLLEIDGIPVEHDPCTFVRYRMERTASPDTPVRYRLRTKGEKR